MKMYVADSLVEKLEAEVNRLYMRGHVAAEHHVQEHALRIVYDEPTVDAEPVVRCKDCKHSSFFKRTGSRYCQAHPNYTFIVGDNNFCSHGAKMDGGVEE